MNEIKIEPGAGGLERAIIRTPLAEAHVYLHGAHVTHFQPRSSKPVLFMSNASWFEAGKPIRGGVPVCFPWFGPSKQDANFPGHGFARLLSWKISGFTSRADGAAVLELTLHESPATQAYWPHEFQAKFSVTVGQALEMALEVTNRSADPITFEEALHTYLTVSDVRNVKITGLEGATRIDRMDGDKRSIEGPEPIVVGAEMDRIYVNTQSAVTVDDAGLGRKILVSKAGSDATVVWNPWIAKAARMADFCDHEWPGMLCVETCNVAENSVKLLPGRSQRMTARVELV